MAFVQLGFPLCSLPRIYRAYTAMKLYTLQVVAGSLGMNLG